MSSIQSSLANFRSIVDEKTGIIRSVEIVLASELDPSVFLVHANPCDTTPLIGIRAANRGAACSANVDRAIVRACGESIERYCSAFFDMASFIYASENELDKEGINYVSFNNIYPFLKSQYSEPNFPFKKVTKGRKIRWTEGFQLGDNDKALLPASCVYVPYLFDHAVEPFTHMPISTGLAAGTNLDNCIDKGIMEILERDALMLIWYLTVPCPRIPVNSCMGLLEEIDVILKSTPKNGPQWFINLLLTDINVPIISAALIDPWNPPLTSFGISANQDPVYALLLALEEASLTRTLLNRSEELISDPQYVHYSHNTLRDHLLSHATSPHLRERLRFLTDQGPVVPFVEIIEKFDGPVNIRKELHGRKIPIYWKDITTPDVESFGFKVTRTIVPGMQPLDNDHRYRFLGGRRLHEIQRFFNRHNGGKFEFNNDPHPFP